MAIPPMIIHSVPRSSRSTLAGSSAYDEERRKAYAADARWERIYGWTLVSAMILAFSVVFFMMAVSKVTITHVKGKIYHYDVRTAPGKVKKPNIVFIHVELPHKVIQMNTGQHVSKCPFVDTKTPVEVKVRTTTNRITGDFMSEDYELMYHPCKLENKL